MIKHLITISNVLNKLRIGHAVFSLKIAQEFRRCAGIAYMYFSEIKWDLVRKYVSRDPLEYINDLLNLIEKEVEESEIKARINVFKRV